MLNKKILTLITKINDKISSEFPNIKIVYISKFNSKTKFEIFYNNTKNNKQINKFNILDGGTKDRIIRKIKYYLYISNIKSKIDKNIILI